MYVCSTERSRDAIFSKRAASPEDAGVDRIAVRQPRPALRDTADDHLGVG
jgi:hypothetical protein